MIKNQRICFQRAESYRLSIFVAVSGRLESCNDSNDKVAHGKGIAVHYMRWQLSYVGGSADSSAE